MLPSDKVVKLLLFFFFKGLLKRNFDGCFWILTDTFVNPGAVRSLQRSTLHLPVSADIMPCMGTPLLLLTLAGFLLPAMLTGYPQAAAPTLWQEPPEFPSGSGPLETTPSVRLSDVTGVPPDTSEPDPTHGDTLGNGDGSLGPGAVAAIVLAALLGTSVLIALIVITLRKFSAA
ncbi:protein SNORC isoform X2 [Ascaphus truei]|uniref:protein SNORC isoform X2 n=1 Tax=Ascaphus truei TaxID=8439 RepID=UPI003F596521